MTQMYRNLVAAAIALASFAVVAQTSGTTGVTTPGGRDTSPSSGAIQDRSGTGTGAAANGGTSGMNNGMNSGSSTGGSSSSTNRSDTPSTSGTYDGMPPTSAGSHADSASNPSAKGPQKSSRHHRKAKHGAHRGDSDPVDPHGGLSGQSSGSGNPGSGADTSR